MRRYEIFPTWLVRATAACRFLQRIYVEPEEISPVGKKVIVLCGNVMNLVMGDVGLDGGPFACAIMPKQMLLGSLYCCCMSVSDWYV